MCQAGNLQRRQHQAQFLEQVFDDRLRLRNVQRVAGNRRTPFDDAIERAVGDAACFPFGAKAPRRLMGRNGAACADRRSIR